MHQLLLLLATRSRITWSRTSDLQAIPFLLLDEVCFLLLYRLAGPLTCMSFNMALHVAWAKKNCRHGRWSCVPPIPVPLLFQTIHSSTLRFSCCLIRLYSATRWSQHYVHSCLSYPLVYTNSRTIKFVGHMQHFALMNNYLLIVMHWWCMVDLFSSIVRYTPLFVTAVFQTRRLFQTRKL